MTAALIDNDRANNPDLVRLIEDGRILIGDYGVPTPPTGVDWDPATDIAAGTRVDLGYYSDSGFDLTPEPGDNKQFKAHNEDVVIDQDGPGTWATKFSSIQQGRRQAEMFFDATIDPANGKMVVSKASVATYRDLVLVGIAGASDLIIAHFPRVKVADRDSMTFNPTDLNAYGMTLRAYRDTTLGYQFTAWSTLWQEGTVAVPTISAASPATTQAEAGNVVITGTGFDGATGVKFGTASATFTINSATQITAIMPAGTSGTANIKVTNSGGDSAPFTYARS